MNRITALLFSAVLAMPFGAQAHDDAHLDKVKAPNGGQLRAAGIYHFELVLAREAGDPKDRAVAVHVTDHAGTAVASAGATGTVTLLGKGGAVRVALAPDGANRLKGAGRYVADPDLKAVVSVTLAGKPAEQARFTPFQAR